MGLTSSLGGRMPPVDVEQERDPWGTGGAAEALGWAVVSRRPPTAALALPEYRLRNRTVLAGLLGLAAGALCLGWTYLVVVRPLKALTRQADALADGDRLTMLPPRHDDEVGAIARNSELIGLTEALT
ncbi:HAMP domain-containing protein [Streptomyces sp. NPDC017520]|uniref:HAMP domain-containing protein n=1 Tax=Streptomyces sp. NPDC017520 TaxID=3364998 RepID=UPI00378ACF7E